MNLSTAVWKDLLALHLAGEASADTRALVEARLEIDPDLARLARESSAAGSTRTLSIAAGPAALPIDRLALRRTQRTLRARSFLLACAITSTVLPLSFQFDTAKGVSFFMLRDAPAQATGLFMIAGALWIAFGLVVRRLRVTGL